jgi:WD40 repeat protein/tRNA A-37 threonylcarbamoyl transferase component Bud32
MTPHDPASWPPIEHLEIQHMLERVQELPAAELVPLVHADQRLRWQFGDRVGLEAYLQYLPKVRDDPAFVLDLLFREAALREEQGQAAALDELVQRFPQYGPQISVQYAQQHTLVVSGTKQNGETVDPNSTQQFLDPGSTAAFQRVVAAPVNAAVPGYEILSELGRGGMGVVYKARHLALNRLVALKMILSGSHASAEELARFRNEAEAVARVQHPNLVQIYEVGEHEGRPYFALEYVDGGPLDQWMRETHPDGRAAARMVEILARAVHAVHQHGLIHRDLKPGNILLTGSGVPKITDFGLAKRLASPGRQSGGDLTATGSILGTPAYMAPEQASGRVKEIGPATDVYALGTMLYEMLAGRPPFQASSGLDLVLMVTRDEPMLPSRVRRHVPRDLETICLKCLEKQPAKRYASAEELAEDLHHFQAGEPIKARPTGPLVRVLKWTRRHPAWAALLGGSAVALVVLLVVGAAYNMELEQALQDATHKGEESRQRLVRLSVARGSQLLDEGDWFGALVFFAEALRLDEGDPAREAMHRLRLGSVLRLCPDLKQMWFHDRAVLQVNFSHDGKYVVTASEDHSARIWDARTGQAVGQPLTHQGPVVDAVFSKDDRWVLTASRDGTARVWNAVTGQPRTPPLNHGAPLVHAVFSPDGQRVATCGNDVNAVIWDAATGKVQSRRPKHLGWINAVAFSPDGQWLATAGADRAARLWRADTGAEGHGLDHAREVLWVAFQEQGKLLVTTSADGTAQLWDWHSGDPVGAKLVHKLPVVHASFSSDGKLVATASADRAARVWATATGEAVSPPLKHASGVTMAVFGLRGNLLVTAGEDNTMRVWSLSTFEELLPLVYYNGSVPAVRFSPDGKLVLSASLSGVVRLVGAREDFVRLLSVLDEPTDHLQQARSASQTQALSADGRRELKANSDNSAGLYDALTKQPLLPPLKHGSKVLHVGFSPHEKRLITAGDDNTARLWSAMTGELLTPPLRHRATVTFAAFSPDGLLVVTASQDETARVWDSKTGEPITPPLMHATAVNQAEIMADGLTVATTDVDGRKLTWKLERDDRPLEAIVRQAQTLSGSYLDPARGYLPLEIEQWRALYAR